MKTSPSPGRSRPTHSYTSASAAHGTSGTAWPPFPGSNAPEWLQRDAKQTNHGTTWWKMHIQYDVIWCDMWCNVMQHDAMWCNMMQCDGLWYELLGLPSDIAHRPLWSFDSTCHAAYCIRAAGISLWILASQVLPWRDVPSMFHRCSFDVPRWTWQAFRSFSPLPVWRILRSEVLFPFAFLEAPVIRTCRTIAGRIHVTNTYWVHFDAFCI